MKKLISFLAFILPLVVLYQFVFGETLDNTEMKPGVMLAMDIKINGHWRHFSSKAASAIASGTYIVLETDTDKLLLENNDKLVTE